MTRLAVLIPVILAVYACDRSQTPNGSESGPAVEDAAETASKRRKSNAFPHWVSMPDPRPRGEVRRGDVSVPPDPNYVQAMGTEIWCVPGCRLANDEAGDPIIPEWCTAWTELSPTYFVRESDEDELTDETSVAAYVGDLIYYDRSKPPVEYVGPTKFACTRIDLALVTVQGTPSLAGKQLPLEGRAISMNGSPPGMTCRPGCTLPWKDFGYKGQDVVGDSMPQYALPRWCVTSHDGCWTVPGGGAFRMTCDKERYINATCRRLRFSDLDY
ncbi:MAG: hypothetical protein AAF719_11040 [Pseudomonadota bacterium]